MRPYRVTVLPTDAPGHALRSDYVRWFWIPALGPTSVALASVLFEEAVPHGEPCELEIPWIGDRCGVNPATVVRCSRRLAEYGPAGLVDTDDVLHLTMPVVWPDVPRRSLRNLSERLRGTHEWMAQALAEWVAS